MSGWWIAIWNTTWTNKWKLLNLINSNIYWKIYCSVYRYLCFSFSKLLYGSVFGYVSNYLTSSTINYLSWFKIVSIHRTLKLINSCYDTFWFNFLWWIFKIYYLFICNVKQPGWYYRCTIKLSIHTNKKIRDGYILMVLVCKSLVVIVVKNVVKRIFHGSQIICLP